LERVEVTGDGTNAVIENNIHLTWYRRVEAKGFRAYGSEGDFTGAMSDAPVVWEPEFSLGNLYNTGIFLLGYHSELRHFCDAVLSDTAITVGTLDDAEEGIRILDAFAKGPGITTNF